MDFFSQNFNLVVIFNQNLFRNELFKGFGLSKTILKWLEKF